MIFGYENLASVISIPQISEMIERGEYNDLKPDRIITVPKHHRHNWPDSEVVRVVLSGVLAPGDVVVTASLLSFSTSTDGILWSIGIILDMGARLISIEENFDSDLLDLQTFEMVMDITKKARDARSTFTKKRIDAAIKEGRYANQVKLSDFPDFKSLYTAYKQRSITKTEIAQRLKISRPTLNKLFEQYQQENDLDKEGENADEIENN